MCIGYWSSDCTTSKCVTQAIQICVSLLPDQLKDSAPCSDNFPMCVHKIYINTKVLSLFHRPTCACDKFQIIALPQIHQILSDDENMHEKIFDTLSDKQNPTSPLMTL